MRLAISCLMLCAAAFGANRYVDSSVVSSGNGLAWATAWKNVSNITGLSAGDVVYFSGGTVSKTYVLASAWAPAGGTSGNPITYRVGQDAGHNGTVIFDLASLGAWVSNPGNWVTIDGEVNGESRIAFLGGAQTSQWVVAQSKTGIVLRYITFPDGDAINLDSTEQYEIAYCYLHSIYDHAVKLSDPTPEAAAFDVNSVHHNTFVLDHASGSGMGVDGIQWGDGVSIYSNTFTGNATAYIGSGQHQDGFQGCGNYTRVYNNTFKNIGNYAIFASCFADATEIQIFNNVIYMSDDRFAAGAQSGIFIQNFDGATATFTAFVVANNTLANYGTTPVITLSTLNAVWDSTSKVHNNVAYSTAGLSIAGGVTSSGNLSLSTGGSSLFAQYQAIGASEFPYDFHLVDAAGTLRGQGVNLTALSIPALNVSRPSSGAWDIGAYQFVPGYSQRHTGGTHSGGRQ